MPLLVRPCLRRAQVDAAQQESHRASALPDPVLAVGVDNLLVTGTGAFDADADFMTMRIVRARVTTGGIEFGDDRAAGRIQAITERGEFIFAIDLRDRLGLPAATLTAQLSHVVDAARRGCHDDVGHRLIGHPCRQA